VGRVALLEKGGHLFRAVEEIDKEVTEVKVGIKGFVEFFRVGVFFLIQILRIDPLILVDIEVIKVFQEIIDFNWSLDFIFIIFSPEILPLSFQ
jgi:hypothetical protein